MKLLRCNIVNYGCLHDFSYEFNEGINLISQPNGWGKSTFVSFLCAMLYGLDSTNRRNIQDNERKHYLPWQGGVFGGSIEFEVSGRQYRAERFFGRREKEDTFALYDLKTMLPCQEYTSRLGFELFAIDKNGYLKSTCIPQGKPAPEYNDTLAARLTGLTQSSDDMLRYEQAVAALDKAIHFYVKTGNRGEIASLQQEADAISAQLQKASEAVQELAHLNSDLTSLNEQKNSIQNQLEQIRKQIHLCTVRETQARYKLLKHQLAEKESELEQLDDFFHDQFPSEPDIEACLQSCHRLSQMQVQIERETFNDAQFSEFAVLQALFDSVDEAFVNKASSEDCSSGNPVFCSSETIFSAKQQQILRNSPEYRLEASVLFDENDNLTDNTIYHFMDELPDILTVHQAEDCYRQYLSLISAREDSNRKADSLSEQLEHLNTELELEYQNLSDCRRKLQQPKLNQKKQLNEKTQMPKIPYLWFFFPLIAAAVSFLTGYFTTPAMGCIVFVSSVILAVFFLRNHRIQLKTELQLRAENCSRLEKQRTELQEQQESVKVKVSAFSDDICSCRQQLLLLSRQLGFSQDDIPELINEYPAYLAQINSLLDNHLQIRRRQEDNRKKQQMFYDRLKSKYENYTIRFQHQKHLKQHISDLRESVADYLSPYFSITEKDTAAAFEVKLHELKSMVDSYKKLLAEMHSASQNLNLFLGEHPDFQNQLFESEQLHHSPQTCSSLSELQSEESLLRNQYDDCMHKISFCQSRIQQLQNLASDYPLLKEKLSKSKQQICEFEERYRILSLTRKYLIKARQDFSDNYLRSIEKNFRHYADILQKDLLQNTSIDSNFHVLVSDGGILRETGWYSQGTRDLIDLCLRLSIIEDLFPDETPFLVLDDPFVNLDEPGLQCLSEILHGIADKWQIIYFTCHSSRNI